MNNYELIYTQTQPGTGKYHIKDYYRMPYPFVIGGTITLCGIRTEHEVDGHYTPMRVDICKNCSRIYDKHYV